MTSCLYIEYGRLISEDFDSRIDISCEYDDRCIEGDTTTPRSKLPQQRTSLPQRWAPFTTAGEPTVSVQALHTVEVHKIASRRPQGLPNGHRVTMETQVSFPPLPPLRRAF